MVAGRRQRGFQKALKGQRTLCTQCREEHTLDGIGEGEHMDTVDDQQNTGRVNAALTVYRI